MTFNKRRSLFALLILAFILLALSSCSSSSKRPGRSLLIYTPHGQDLLKDFVARYKQAYPDVDVQFLDMGAQEILGRLRAERNRHPADLWWGASHTTATTAAAENLLAAYRPTCADKARPEDRDP